MTTTSEPRLNAGGSWRARFAGPGEVVDRLAEGELSYPDAGRLLFRWVEEWATPALRRHLAGLEDVHDSAHTLTVSCRNEADVDGFLSELYDWCDDARICVDPLIHWWPDDVDAVLVELRSSPTWTKVS